MIFIPIFILFFAFFSSEIKASDYQINITSVTGLIYGNKLKDATINGDSNGVDGEFSFYNKEMVLDKAGEINLEIIFIPRDSSEIKRINYTAIVEKRKISIFFVSPIYKQYDGTSSIELPQYTYQGIINNEVEIQGELAASLSGTYVSEGIPLILSGVEIVGDKKDCYYLDLQEHSARVYPSTLSKVGVNETEIILDKDVYVDIGYSLTVELRDSAQKINDKYTGFRNYKYEVYSHNNILLEVDSKYQVKMSVDEEVRKKERLVLFELTKNGEYKKIGYKMDESDIYFTIDSDSEVVFATRNIEYHFIILFSSVLCFYGIFLVAYRWKCSRKNNNDKY